MKIGSNASKEEDAAGGGRSGKPPHWRRREQVATAVYVVHPTQFRTVVQQLTGTGAASQTPLSTHAPHQRVAGGGNNGAAVGTRINAVSQHGRGEQSGGSSTGRTLGQMRQDCLDWANDDDN